MVPTHSRHDKRTTAKNGTRLLKPVINLRRLEKRDEGKHDEKNNVVLTPVKSTALSTKHLWRISGTGPLKSGCCSRKNIPSASLDRMLQAGLPSTP